MQPATAVWATASTQLPYNETAPDNPQQTQRMKELLI